MKRRVCVVMVRKSVRVRVREREVLRIGGGGGGAAMVVFLVLCRLFRKFGVWRGFLSKRK